MNINKVESIYFKCENKENCLNSENSKNSNNIVRRVNSVFVDHSLSESEFCQSQFPDCWYPLVKKGNYIKAKISPEDKNTRNLIYIFWNEAENKVLINKTEQAFSKRMAHYFSKFNSKNLSTNEFVRDVRAHYENIKLAILYRLKKNENIDKVEAAFIRTYSQVGYRLYNKKNGGAGGRARGAEVSSFYALPNTNEFPSPARSYPVKAKKNGIHLDTSPGFKKKIKKDREVASQLQLSRGFAYRYKFTPSSPSKPVIRYLGASGIPEVRVPKHCNASMSAQSEFHKLLNEMPEKFEAGIIPVELINPETLSPNSRSQYKFFPTLGEVEIELIAMGKSSGKVFNKNKGGGGPIPRKLCFDESQSASVSV